MRESVYSKNGIYNCDRVAYVANNYICIDDISIISKSKKEDDDISISLRG